MKIVVLSSGGVDSSVMLLLYKKEGHSVWPLHVDYGQLAEEREWNACQSICERLQVNEPVRIDTSGFRRIPSGLTNPELDIVRAAFLPTRNLLMLTIGSAYAYSISGDAVAIGILSNPIFPDQKLDFLTAAQACVRLSLDLEIKILSPLIALDKRDTLRLARKYSLPLELTYFCHSGKEKPCGVCLSCRERIGAEKNLSLFSTPSTASTGNH